MVNTKAPMAQIPSVTAISTKLGVYSAILPHGPGMNPGTINPNPFSIQMAINNMAHTTYNIFKLLLNLWNVKIIVATTFKLIDVQIHGNNAVLPSKPKNK